MWAKPLSLSTDYALKTQFDVRPRLDLGLLLTRCYNIYYTYKVYFN